MGEGKLRILDDGLLAFYCPGCGHYHVLNIDKSNKPKWEFNGDYDKPTFSPSILVTNPNERCHSFVKDGRIQYLTDCTHKLAGETVDMESEL